MTFFSITSFDSSECIYKKKSQSILYNPPKQILNGDLMSKCQK